MIPTENLRALRIFAEKLAGKGIHWALTGSSNLALQKVDVEAHDLDILTTKEGALEIGMILKESVKEPIKYSEAPNFKSYHGMLEIAGVKLDIMGDLAIKDANGAWVEGNRLSKLVSIKAGDIQVPAVDLRHEYRAYLSMGRIEKALKIKAALERLKSSGQ